MNLLVKKVNAKQCLPMRAEVLRPGRSIEEVGYIDDNFDTSFHLAAFDDEKLVGISTFLLDQDQSSASETIYRLRGMASSPAARGKNIGRRLIEEAINELKNRDCTRLWCNARENAFGFYEKLGFQYDSEMFEIPEVGPHKKMYIDISYKS